jgi:hypothetical protein
MDTLFLDITDSSPSKVRHVERVMMQQQEGGPDLLGMPVTVWLAILIPVFLIGVFWLIRVWKQKQDARKKTDKHVEELMIWTGRFIRTVDDQMRMFLNPSQQLSKNTATSQTLGKFKALEPIDFRALVHPNGNLSNNGRFERYLDFIEAVETSKQIGSVGQEKLEDLAKSKESYQKAYEALIDYIHEFFTEISTSVSDKNPPDAFLLKLFEIRNEWYVQARKSPESEEEISFRELFQPLEALCDEQINSGNADQRPFLLKEKIARVTRLRERNDNHRKALKKDLQKLAEYLDDQKKAISDCAEYLGRIKN